MGLSLPGAAMAAQARNTVLLLHALTKRKEPPAIARLVREVVAHVFGLLLSIICCGPLVACGDMQACASRGLWFGTGGRATSWAAQIRQLHQVRTPFGGRGRQRVKFELPDAQKVGCIRQASASCSGVEARLVQVSPVRDLGRTGTADADFVASDLQSDQRKEASA